MFKITNNNIEVTRGDEIKINLQISGYTFKSGDSLKFNIYKENGLTETPVVSKTIQPSPGDSVLITLTSQETTIGEPDNKAITYWYTIVLNNKTTILGYDGHGAKKFIIYPKGV